MSGNSTTAHEPVHFGSLTFVDKVKNELGFKALHREFEPLGDSYALRERSEAYARQFAVENEALSSRGGVRDIL